MSYTPGTIESLGAANAGDKSVDCGVAIAIAAVHLVAVAWSVTTVVNVMTSVNVIIDQDVQMQLAKWRAWMH